MAQCFVFVCIVIASGSLALGVDISSVESPREVKGRFFFPVIMSFISEIDIPNQNITMLASLLAGLSSSMLSLMTLLGLGFLAATGGGIGRSFNKRIGITDLDWDSLSLLEWLYIVQDVWVNFDPLDPQCRNRFMCELHHNRRELGPVADSLIYYFSYLEYGNVFQLPEALKSPLREYLYAAEIGDSQDFNCSDVYDCNFSLKDFVLKHSRIKSHIHGDNYEHPLSYSNPAITQHGTEINKSIDQNKNNLGTESRGTNEEKQSKTMKRTDKVTSSQRHRLNRNRTTYEFISKTLETK